jgi:hypothetical protein
MVINICTPSNVGGKDWRLRFKAKLGKNEKLVRPLSTNKQGMSAHVGYTSCTRSEGGGRRIMDSSWPQGNIRPYLRNKLKQKVLRHDSSVTAFASKHRALSSKSSTIKPPPPKTKKTNSNKTTQPFKTLSL